MEIQMMPIDSVKPYPKNPRINEKAVDFVKKSLEEFGFQQPLVVDSANIVIVGHTRLLAAKELNMAEVPVHVAKNLSDDQIKAYRIADNKTAEHADWNMTLLSEQVIELNNSEFDLDSLGFSEVELDGLLVGPVGDGEDDENLDNTPPVPKEAKSMLGSIYRLGRHRLIVGDSTDKEVLEQLMDGDEADLFFTDPPYGVNYEGIHNDDRDGLKNLLNSVFSNCREFSKKGSSVYCFHSDRCADIFHEVFRAYCHFSSMCIWVKPSLVLSQTDYQSKHEPCMYGWFDNGTHKWHNDRKQTTVWEYGKEKVEGHTTPKPVDMIIDAIKNSSYKGAIVLDPFGGSGSTLIAAEKSGRTCRMIELDPKYADVIRKRYAELKHGKGCDWEKLTES